MAYDLDFNKIIFEDRRVDQFGNKLPENPMQPLYFDEHGTIRFKPNSIVQYLLEAGGIDLNHLAYTGITQKWCNNDWEQFMQLIGYSVSGYGDLSEVRDHILEQADEMADKLRNKV